MDPNIPHLSSAKGQRKERYAYMFKAGKRHLLFIRNLGSGVESVAQLVEDIDSGDVLVRKVTASRLLKAPDEDWRPKPPREIRILNAIQDTFRDPEPGLLPLIARCYGHEYIRSESKDSAGHPKYHSVSYWKLCNGGSMEDRWFKADRNGQILGMARKPPVTIVARMIRQVLSRMHYLYTAGEKPVYHQDVHFGNIWAHWTAEQPLPDFYLGDFADAAFADEEFSFDLVTQEDNTFLARPVLDLYKFSLNLGVLRKGIADTRDDLAMTMLIALFDAIHQAVEEWRETGTNKSDPPNLRELIEKAQCLEDMCMQGGIADETQSDVYLDYVEEERKNALALGREQALIVRDTRSTALNPLDPAKEIIPGPIMIHGPWHLVRLGWEHVKAEGITHHRPNEDFAMRPPDKLSMTDKRPDQVPQWIESADSAPQVVSRRPFFDSSPPPRSPVLGAGQERNRQFSWNQEDEIIHVMLKLPADPAARKEEGKSVKEEEASEEVTLVEEVDEEELEEEALKFMRLGDEDCETRLGNIDREVAGWAKAKDHSKERRAWRKTPTVTAGLRSGRSPVPNPFALEARAAACRTNIAATAAYPALTLLAVYPYRRQPQNAPESLRG